MSDPPHETILLSVLGQSPAVLTETLWALSRENPPTFPDRIIVLTTAIGRRILLERFFAGKEGATSLWSHFRTNLLQQAGSRPSRLRFGTTSDDIRVLTRFDPASGQTIELDDIRTVQENEATSDFLLDQIRGLVENPDLRLILSLAGGRKTMGILLYAAMSLLGRATDRITHVLVDEPYETLRDFYYPEQPEQKLHTPTGREVLASNAQITLADLPFVPLGRILPAQIGRKPGRFSALVRYCRLEEGLPDDGRSGLQLRSGQPGLEVAGDWVPFSPREYLILLGLFDQVRRGTGPCGSMVELADRLESFRQCLVDGGIWTDWRQDIRQPLDADALRHDLSSMRNKLRRHAGPAGVDLAHRLPKRGTCFLDLPLQQLPRSD